MKKLMFLSSLIAGTVLLSSNSAVAGICPDGKIVSETYCVMTPDGEFIGSNSRSNNSFVMTPDGKYASGKKLVIDSNGSFIGDQQSKTNLYGDDDSNSSNSSTTLKPITWTPMCRMNPRAMGCS